MSKKWLIISMICALSASLLFAGCSEPSPPQIVDMPSSPPIVGPLLVHRGTAGRSVENRLIEYLALGQGQDVTFILATIHGNEPAGTPLVQRFSKYLQQHPELLQGRKVVLMPVANPDGMAHNTRYNVNGVDLNRNFATANRTNIARHGRNALSEPEARAIESVIRQYSPDRIVSIHQPLACIDYDGPAWALACRMAEHCALPVRKLGAQPGSLGSYAGVTLGIPIVTFEMLPSDSALSQETLWQRYGKTLIAAVVYPQAAN